MVEVGSLIFHAAGQSFTHSITFGSLVEAASGLRNQRSGFTAICDEFTESYAKQLGVVEHVIRVPRGEQAKSMKVALFVYDNLQSQGLTRRSSKLLGVGGGAICDLTGFVAMTYMRGVSYALFPTTLLAMVDASIGCKVGINAHNGTKNLLGGFYAPVHVHIALETLQTLPDREFFSAFAEIIKVACLCQDQGQFFETIQAQAAKYLQRDYEALRTIIEKAINIKINYVQSDLLEQDLDRALNLGHSIAHALESISNYGLLHGECVSIGISAAVRAGYARGLCPENYSKRVLDLLSYFNLPTVIPAFINRQALLQELRTIRCIRDSALREVIPTAPGSFVIIPDLPLDLLINCGFGFHNDGQPSVTTEFLPSHKTLSIINEDFMPREFPLKSAV